MLFDPTERDVNPFLARTGIRTMTELILALTIHDQESIIAWTGLTLPFEERLGPKAH